MSGFSVTGEIDVLSAQFHFPLEVAHKDQRPLEARGVMGIGSVAHIDDHRVIQHVAVALRGLLELLRHLGNQAEEPVAHFLIMLHAFGIALVATHVAIGMITQVYPDAQVGLGVDLGGCGSDGGDVAQASDQGRSGQLKLGLQALCGDL